MKLIKDQSVCKITLNGDGTATIKRPGKEPVIIKLEAPSKVK